MIKFGFRIKTRGGMLVDKLLIAAHDREDAERKLRQIYRDCEILECLISPQATKEEAFDVESAIDLIGKGER